MPFIWQVSRGGHAWSGPPESRVLKAKRKDLGSSDYAPLDDHTGLFWTFSTAEPDEAGILAFANKFGLLGTRSMDTVWRTKPDEHLDVWAGQIREMSAAVKKWDELRKRQGCLAEKSALYEAVNSRLLESALSRDYGDLPRSRGDARHAFYAVMDKIKRPPFPGLQIITAAEDGTLSLELRPVNLLNALWLQFAYAIVRNTDFRQCPFCGSWFAIAPAQRRADATFCRVGCRVRAYKVRKKEARRLHSLGRPLRAIAKELGTTAEIAKGWVSATNR